MKVKIKNFNGELPEYLTQGKEYMVAGISGTGRMFWAFSDDKQLDCFLFNECEHLNGGSWELVD